MVTKYIGTLTYRTVLEQWDEVRSHPDFDPTFSYLTDLSELTEYAITTEEARDLAKLNDPFSPGSRRIVVATTDFVFGMVRMYQMSGVSHPNLTVVRSLEAARSLLGL